MNTQNNIDYSSLVEKGIKNVVVFKNFQYEDSNAYEKFKQQLEDKEAKINDLATKDFFDYFIEKFEKIVANESAKEKAYCEEMGIPYYNGIIAVNSKIINYADLNEQKEKVKAELKKLKGAQNKIQREQQERGMISNQYSQRIAEFYQSLSGGQLQHGDFFNGFSQKEQKLINAMLQSNFIEDWKLDVNDLTSSAILTIVEGYLMNHYEDIFSHQEKPEKIIDSLCNNMLKNIKQLQTSQKQKKSSLQILKDYARDFIDAGIFISTDILQQDIDNETQQIRLSQLQEKQIKALKASKKPFTAKEMMDFHVKVNSQAYGGLGLMAEFIKSIIWNELNSKNHSVFSYQAGSKGGKTDICTLVLTKGKRNANRGVSQTLLKNIEKNIITTETNKQWSDDKRLDDINQEYNRFITNIKKTEQTGFLIYESAKEYNYSSYNYSGFSAGAGYTINDFTKHIFQQIADLEYQNYEKDIEQALPPLLKHLATNLMLDNSASDYLSLNRFLSLFMVGLLFDDGRQMIRQILDESSVGAQNSKLQTLHVFSLTGRTVTVSFLINRILTILKTTATLNSIINFQVEGGDNLLQQYNAIKNNDTSMETKWEQIFDASNDTLKIKVHFLSSLRNALNEAFK